MKDSKEFIPVRTSTLRGDQKINFDLYIHLRERHVLYIRNGDSFEGDRLTRLKEKKLKKMFILEQEEEQYRRYISTNLNMAYESNSGKDIGQRSEIVQGHQQTNAEDVMENPENAVAYSIAKDGTNMYLDFLQNSEGAMKTILEMENTDKTLGHHGVTVSTIAVGLAQKLGITDRKQLQYLSLGCLLHDMGHTLHDVKYDRPLSLMSKEELATYQRHPSLGVEKVKDLQHFDAPVLKIILQHEETIDGKGYPGALTEKNIDPLALICGVANAYDRMVTFNGLKHAEAAKQIMIDKVGRYPLGHLKGLQSVLKELNLY